MNVDSDFERTVRAWAALGSDQLPDTALDAALHTIGTTPQRRARWPAWRFPLMDNPVLRFGVIAAAIVALAAVGVSLLSSNVGNRPPPVVSPTPSPEALSGADLDDPLAAGVYSVGIPFETAFTIALPADWRLQRLNIEETVFGSDSPDGNPSVGLFKATLVYADPCHPEDGYQRPETSSPSSAEELATDLASLAGFEASSVTSEQISGRTAYRVSISNSIDTSTAGCTDDQLLSLFDLASGEPAATNGGTAQEVWAVDLGGGDAVLVVAETGDQDVDARLQQIEEIVASLRFP
jgi:hypothetical protein